MAQTPPTASSSPRRGSRIIENGRFLAAAIPLSFSSLGMSHSDEPEQAVTVLRSSPASERAAFEQSSIPSFDELRNGTWLHDPVLIERMTEEKISFPPLPQTTPDGLTHDHYAVRIEKLPEGLTPQSLLSSFVEDPNTAVGNLKFSVLGSFQRRSYDHPPRIGDVYDIDGIGPFNPAIILLDRKENYIVVGAADNLATQSPHPEMGIRVFGFHTNPDGSTSFFTRGVSLPKTGSVPDVLVRYGQQQVWTSMTNGIAASISLAGGTAHVEEPLVFVPTKAEGAFWDESARKVDTLAAQLAAFDATIRELEARLAAGQTEAARALHQQRQALAALETEVRTRRLEDEAETAAANDARAYVAAVTSTIGDSLSEHNTHYAAERAEQLKLIESLEAELSQPLNAHQRAAVEEALANAQRDLKLADEAAIDKARYNAAELRAASGLASRVAELIENESVRRTVQAAAGIGAFSADFYENVTLLTAGRLGTFAFSMNTVDLALGLFRTLSGAPSADQIIIEQLTELRSELAEMRGEIDQRLSAIDGKLVTLLSLVDEGFEIVIAQNKIIRDQLSRIEATLNETAATVARIERAADYRALVEANMVIAKLHFDSVASPYELSENEVKAHLSAFTFWGAHLFPRTRIATGGTVWKEAPSIAAAGRTFVNARPIHELLSDSFITERQNAARGESPAAAPFDDEEIFERQWTPASAANWIATALVNEQSRVNWPFPASAIRSGNAAVPNVSLWAFGADSYLRLCARYPAYHDAPTVEHLDLFIKSGEDIQQTLERIRHPQVLGALFARYGEVSDNLQASLVALEAAVTSRYQDVLPDSWRSYSWDRMRNSYAPPTTARMLVGRDSVGNYTLPPKIQDAIPLEYKLSETLGLGSLSYVMTAAFVDETAKVEETVMRRVGSGRDGGDFMPHTVTRDRTFSRPTLDVMVVFTPRHGESVTIRTFRKQLEREGQNADHNYAARKIAQHWDSFRADIGAAHLVGSNDDPLKSARDRLQSYLDGRIARFRSLAHSALTGAAPDDLSAAEAKAVNDLRAARDEMVGLTAMVRMVTTLAYPASLNRDPVARAVMAPGALPDATWFSELFKRYDQLPASSAKAPVWLFLQQDLGRALGYTDGYLISAANSGRGFKPAPSSEDLEAFQRRYKTKGGIEEWRRDARDLLWQLGHPAQVGTVTENIESFKFTMRQNPSRENSLLDALAEDFAVNGPAHSYPTVDRRLEGLRVLRETVAERSRQRTP